MENFVYKKIDNNLNLEASLYKSSSDIDKGILLYFHGGGFLYGNRNDLPEYHINKLNSAGYSILAFDYRLAPESEFSSILEDIIDGIQFFIHKKNDLGLADTPYFLWGRSAGAYLVLLASTKDLSIIPNGIISYYGYGFTIPNWYNQGSIHYLKYPEVKKNQISDIIKDYPIGNGYIHERFPLYVYSRQTGNWINLISNNNEMEFMEKYSLLNIDKDFEFPPVFLAHSFLDQDVPFKESTQLSKIIKDSILFTCSSPNHDFDRDIKDKNTIDLLDKTINFLDANL